MGKFICSKRKNGEFQFNLNANNGQIILTSEGYTAESGCSNGIESVKKNAPDDAKYERKTATNGKHYFVLKAGNGQIIGTSQMYADEGGCEKGIASVKSNAPGATIEDEKS